jgi:hypothetical protein
MPQRPYARRKKRQRRVKKLERWREKQAAEAQKSGEKPKSEG